MKKISRKKFLALSGFGASGLLTGLYTWQVEPYWLEFVKVKMPVKNLPQSLHGKTLMQISDVHVGDVSDQKYLINAFEKAKKYAPDIVVYTGDFVSYLSSRQYDQLKEVFESPVHGKMGTYGILGNHDYGHNWAEGNVANNITGILEKSSIHILRNERTTVNGLNITGLDDFWSSNYNPSPIIRTIESEKANIVLCHNPDVMDEPVWHGYNSWVLSGHTHGGQCKPPFLPPPMLPVKNRQYTAGQFDFDDGRKLYINRALGNLFPVRFNVRPEITVFEMEKT